MAEFIRSFNDIVGHKYVLNYLQNKLSTDSVPQSIIFSGSPGLGKTSIAKLLAIAINGNKPSLIKSVIDENQSTDCIKLFNMSSVGDNVESVVAEMQTAKFSSTLKKVIILDEVHGMTSKAQDAILVHLEYLPENIYVFMCTTEVSMLRESLLSRCITFNLNNLSFYEIKQVISKKLSVLGLSFNMPRDVVINLIATWSNNQPRRALNLLESLDKNTLITQDILSAFISTDNVPICIQIIKYLYGSLTNGIEFLSSLSITSDLLDTLLDVLKVALGHSSGLISESDAITIRNIFAEYDIDNFLKFVVKVNTFNSISRRVFISRFIEYHYSIYNKGSCNFKVSEDKTKVMYGDLKTIGDNSLEHDLLENQSAFDKALSNATSIDALFSEGQGVL